MINNGFRVDEAFIWLNFIIVAVFVVSCLVSWFITIKLIKEYEDLYIHVKKLERDVELKYEDIKKFVCPKDIKIYTNEKCKTCNSKINKDECWKQHFIDRMKEAE